MLEAMNHLNGDGGVLKYSLLKTLKSFEHAYRCFPCSDMEVRS